jgi:L-phenylalanine/L-methionine N-acetyltransferase
LGARPEGLVIRPLSLADAAEIHQLCTLPGTTWGTNQITSQGIERVQRRIEGMVTDANSHALVAELEGRVVGSATLRVGNSKRRHTGDIGITIHDDHIGRGIGRALVEALLDLADNTLGLKRVELDVITDNAAAIHLYESLGFEREGIKRCALFRGGQFVDLLMMGRIRA